MKKIITDFKMNVNGIDVVEFQIWGKDKKPLGHLRIERGQIIFVKRPTNLMKENKRLAFYLSDLFDKAEEVAANNGEATPIEITKKAKPTQKTQLATHRRTGKRAARVFWEPSVKLGKSKKK